MSAYERSVLHHDQNRKCGKGYSELGLEWFALQLKRDMDRGWRHFWDQPHRKGMEPPENSWRINRNFWLGVADWHRDRERKT